MVIACYKRDVNGRIVITKENKKINSTTYIIIEAMIHIELNKQK